MDTDKENQTLIKEANRCFKEKKFKEAEQLYIRAGKKLGADLVEASIWLCKKRQQSLNVYSKTRTSSSITDAEAYSAENFFKQKKQLEQTQQLLEDYYQQTQNLKLQLMQRN
ncbi:hypothetical protein ACOJR9_16635 [Alteromonas sp. A081]|uniref:hypothetical protein n=1 Tax=Alteromonas sp. A081 TaxID=3410269 RepID=UPI003B97FA9A